MGGGTRRHGDRRFPGPSPSRRRNTTQDQRRSRGSRSSESSHPDTARRSPQTCSRTSSQASGQLPCRRTSAQAPPPNREQPTRPFHPFLLNVTSGLIPARWRSQGFPVPRTDAWPRASRRLAQGQDPQRVTSSRDVHRETDLVGELHRVIGEGLYLQLTGRAGRSCCRIAHRGDSESVRVEGLH